MDQKLKHSCGLFGVFGHKDAVKLTYLGLFALQHRGQESVGITTIVNGRLNTYKKMGLVSDVFDDDLLHSLTSHASIGHIRYSTVGDSSFENAQPISIVYAKGSLAIAHNGTLINGETLRTRLEKEGSIFQTSSDSEVFLHLIAKSRKKRFGNVLVEAFKAVKGAYSLIFLTPKEMIGVRDPLGFRPLCLGQIDSSYVLASETCAFDLIGAKFIREIAPGEMLRINKDGLRQVLFSNTTPKGYCIFELIYFARPDSSIFNENMHEARVRMGRRLSKESYVPADVVIPIPDSGVSAAIGYAEESGIPYNWGLVRNRYVGRTFISPTQAMRKTGVHIKLNPIREVLAGKRVVVIDDSIVRGNTCKKIIKMIRQAGAREVHLRIGSPPIKFPCFYGIDTPTRKELIASTHTLDEVRRHMRVDTLQYLSIDGLLSCVKEPENFCTACFSGKYPVKWVDN